MGQVSSCNGSFKLPALNASNKEGHTVILRFMPTAAELQYDINLRTRLMLFVGDRCTNFGPGNIVESYKDLRHLPRAVILVRFTSYEDAQSFVTSMHESECDGRQVHASMDDSNLML